MADKQIKDLPLEDITKTTNIEIEINGTSYRTSGQSLIDLIDGFAFSGLKFASYGDSLVGISAFQPYVASRLGMTHYNRGIGGTHVVKPSFEFAWVDNNGVYINKPTAQAGDPITSKLSSDVSSGSNTVDVNDGSVFTAGKNIIIYDWSGASLRVDISNYETATISSIDGNTLTLSSNLSNSYTTADDARIDEYPNNSSLINASLSTQDRVDTIATDTDLILILGGANDGVASGTIGDAADESGNFYQAYKIMLDRIRTRIGNQAIIVTLGLPFHGTADSNDDISGGYNDVREAVDAISYAYGYPFINLRKECGWNADNYSTFLVDSVHMNDTGGKRIANIIIGYLKRLFNDI
jgi:lysophospholipase L1-like esterase